MVTKIVDESTKWRYWIPYEDISFSGVKPKGYSDALINNACWLPVYFVMFNSPKKIGVCDSVEFGQGRLFERRDDVHTIESIEIESFICIHADANYFLHFADVCDLLHFRSTSADDEPKVRDNFYEALQLYCVKYKMTSPIILYGRLYEEERFQYVSVS